MTQSTSLMIRGGAYADVSPIPPTLIPHDKKKLAESPATWIVRVSTHRKCKLYATEAKNIEGQNYLTQFYLLALPSCYTEEGVQYKVELDGQTNLNADDGDKQQASMEECRTYCRHLNLLILDGSDCKNILSLQGYICRGRVLHLQSGQQQMLL